MNQPAASARPYETLQEIFAFAARAPAEVGVTFYGTDRSQDLHSYAELERGAGRFAAALIRQGVEPGDRVALVLRTSPEFYHALFGALYAGALPTCLYPPVRLGRLEDYHRSTARMLEAVGAKVVVSDRTIHRLLGRTHQLVGAKTEFLRVEDLEAEGATLAPAEPAAAHPDDIAVVQFSSGTTMDPKPVALSHANVLANVDGIGARFPVVHAEQRTVSWLPLYHDMGLVGSLFTSLVTPTPLTLIRPEHFLARPRLWLEAMHDSRATVTVAPNFAYGLCVERLKGNDLSDLDLSSMLVALNGAEPIHHATLEHFLELVAPCGFRREVMTPVYGLAEATLAVTFSNLEDPPHNFRFDAERLEKQHQAELLPEGGEADRRPRVLTSVGTPLPGIELEIRDESGRSLEPGQVGEVFARGPSVMRGYFARPQETAAVVERGWLSTGDLGFLHEGELFLCGRAKDLIILRGRNHDPAGMELAAGRVAGVRTGCVVAVADRDEDEEEEHLLLLVERRPSEAASDEDIAGSIHQAVMEASGLLAREVVLLEPGVLPRTSSGKLRRAESLRRFRAGELTPPDQVTWYRMARALYDGWRSHRRGSRAGRER